MMKTKKKIAALMAFLSVAFFVASPALAADFTSPSNTTGTAGTDFWGYTGVGSVHYYGQTFTAATKNIHSVAIKMSRQANDSNVTTNNRQMTLDILEGADCGTGSNVGSYTMSATNVIDKYPFNTDSTYAIPVYTGELTVGNSYCARLTVSTFTGGTFMAIANTSNTYANGIARRELNDNLWHDVTGADTWFQVTGEIAPVYGITAPLASIISPAAYDVIRAQDLEDGLQVFASSDHLESDGGTITFKYFLAHYSVDAATGTLAVNNTYTVAGDSYDAVNFTIPGISIPTTCGISDCEYTLGVGACFGNYCGSYATRQIHVLNTDPDIVNSGSTNPLDTFTSPFPPFTCSGSIIDLCIGYTLGTWFPSVLSWFFVPPPIGAFDPSSIFSVFQTRWPFAYVFGPITAWQGGYAGGSSCPLPMFLGSTIMGQTMPTFDLCDTLDGVGDAVEANTWGKGVIQWAIYLSALFFVLRAAENIHKGKKK